MKKSILAAALCLALALLPTGLAGERPVDIDFTRLGVAEAANALWDLLDAPEENGGKTARLAGQARCIVRDLESGRSDFYLTVEDPSSCCAIQIAFVPAEAPDLPDPQAVTGKPITVTGQLEFFDAGGFADLRIVNAEVDWPAG